MSLLIKYFVLWWKNNPIRGWICLSSFFLHTFCILFLITSSPSIKKQPPQKLVVRTFQTKVLTEKKPSSSSRLPQSTPPAVPSRSPVKNTPKQPSKAKPKAPIETKTAPKKQTPSPKKEPVVKKTEPRSTQINKKPDPLKQSLQKIEENIAKIESKRVTMAPKSELSVPPQIVFSSEILQNESGEEDEQGYISTLVDYLQQNLQLPDVGEVKIALTLRPDGSIDNIKVLTAESEKNRKRLEENLPKLKFPRPKTDKNTKQAQTFIFTFCNEL